MGCSPRAAHSAASFGSLEIDPDHPAPASPEAPGPLRDEHPFAASDVDDRSRGRRRGEQLGQGRAQAGHHPAEQWVARAVLVERVAGRDARGWRSYLEGLRRSVSIPALSPGGPGAGSAGRPGWLVVVRRLDAELQLDPPHPLERALGERPLRSEQIADHPEVAEQHGGDEQHRAEDQRLDVAKPTAAVGVVDEEADEDGKRARAR